MFMREMAKRFIFSLTKSIEVGAAMWISACASRGLGGRLESGSGYGGGIGFFGVRRRWKK